MLTVTGASWRDPASSPSCVRRSRRVRQGHDRDHRRHRNPEQGMRARRCHCRRRPSRARSITSSSQPLIRTHHGSGPRGGAPNEPATRGPGRSSNSGAGVRRWGYAVVARHLEMLRAQSRWVPIAACRRPHRTRGAGCTKITGCAMLTGLPIAGSPSFATLTIIDRRTVITAASGAVPAGTPPRRLQDHRPDATHEPGAARSIERQPRQSEHEGDARSVSSGCTGRWTCKTRRTYK